MLVEWGDAESAALYRLNLSALGEVSMRAIPRPISF